MTRARKPKAPAFDQDLTGKVQSEPDPIDPEDEELDNVFREFPQHDACLELWRTTEKGGKPSFVTELTPSEFTFGNVMREFGGGRYIVKGRYKDGEPIKRSFDVEGDPYPVKRKIPQATGNVTPMPLVQTVELPRRDDGSVDMVAGMMTMMKTLVTELKSSEDQVLDKMMKYKTLFASAEKPQQPITEAIGLIKSGIELAQSGGGGESGGFPWLLALDKLQGPLTELVSTIKVAMTQGRPGAVALPVSGPVPTPPKATEPERPTPSTGEPQNMEMILKGAVAHLLPNLISGAARGSDHGAYADFLLDQIPRNFYATAKDWLSKPDILDQLKSLNPAVGQHEIWFGSLRTELVTILTEELAPDAVGPLQSEPASDPATGSPSDL